MGEETIFAILRRKFVKLCHNSLQRRPMMMIGTLQLPMLSAVRGMDMDEKSYIMEQYNALVMFYKRKKLDKLRLLEQRNRIPTIDVPIMMCGLCCASDALPKIGGEIGPRRQTMISNDSQKAKLSTKVNHVLCSVDDTMRSIDTRSQAATETIKYRIVVSSL